MNRLRKKAESAASENIYFHELDKLVTQLYHHHALQARPGTPKYSEAYHQGLADNLARFAFGKPVKS